MSTTIECGPENCPLTAWTALSPSERKLQRKPLARKMYEQGFTMEEIAKQFGVSHVTIVNDLRDICKPVTNVKERGTDTLGRKKSTGRPKGSTKPRPSHHDDMVEMKDQGLSAKEIAARTGVTPRQVDLVLQREAMKREAVADAEPEIDIKTLSMSAQQKLDTAIRAHKKQLDACFEQRVLAEIRRRIDEMILPHWQEKIDQAQELYKHRRGAMDKTTFNKIRRALHPDSRNSISDKVLAEAFDTFMSLEKFLLDEKESPTDFNGLPRTLAEWEAAKAATTAARKAKGGQHSNLSQAPVRA